MRNQNFIDRDKLYGMLDNNAPSESQLNDILNKARKLKGLNLEDVAKLLCVENEADIQKILDTAEYCKDEIYGRRLVLFAPIYTGNACVNNCVYCGFRRDNKALKRKILTLDEIETETLHLLRMGHKRALLICGESPRNDANYMVEAIRRCYAAKDEKGSTIRRINVELAPMSLRQVNACNGLLLRLDLRRHTRTCFVIRVPILTMDSACRLRSLQWCNPTESFLSYRPCGNRFGRQRHTQGCFLRARRHVYRLGK